MNTEGRGELAEIHRRFRQVLDDAEVVGITVAAHIILTKMTRDMNNEAGETTMRFSRNVEAIQHDCSDMADPTP